MTDRDGAGAQPPVRPRSLDALEFERRPMVQWLSPSILAAAALRVVVSTVFGQYADKREFQAALDPDAGPPTAYWPEDGAGGALWMDFASDLGDGFDSTYAVASLLGRRELAVEGHTLPRGRVLVLGGDQVYPDPTREAYRHRFRGPYAAALPWSDVRPDLFAIPGNHDWYDGLTSFLRLFCGARDIGGWRTRQRRSYFALRLPHQWWLLGIDIQLDTYIDRPQLEYFRGIGLQRGDQVVLVTGKPSWVKTEGGAVPDSYANLCYFEEEVVQAAGAEVRAFLSGDLHHYARYAAPDGGQLVTAGGGGAYLSPTHRLPERLDLPRGRPAYECEATFPERHVSCRLARGAVPLPLRAPALCALVGGWHALIGLALFAALTGGAGWAAAVAVLSLALAGCLVGYCSAKTTALRLALGGAHAAVHLALAAAPALVAAQALDASGVGAGLLVTAVTAATGFALGGVAFGLYLLLTHPLVPAHANEVLACQAIADYKCFLRIRLDAGGLTIFPIGIREVPREWEPAPHDPPDAPFLRPADRPLEAHLIEEPVHVPPGPGRPAPQPVAVAPVEA